MDIAKSLVKCVARAFYDTRHILVLDALMIHNALRDDELARLLGLVTKDVHKLCGKLKEDRMITVHSRPEQKDGQQRPVNRTYYYIEFRSVIDGIKYRVYQLAALVRKSVNNGADTKGYVCPHCNKRFALLDAVSLDQDSEGLFLCDRCQNPLVDDEESAETKLGHEKIQRMNRQIEKIEKFLKEVDAVIIPFNDFETAIANSVPVPRDKNQLPTATFVPVTNKKGDPAKSQQTIEINITSSEEKTTEELRAEQEKKKIQAEKNALPVWHTQSTVQPGAITNAGLKEAAEKAARERDGVGLARRELEVEEKTKGEEGGQGDAIAQYYAALAAEKAREEAEEADSSNEEEEEDDEDVDFEDLDISAPRTGSEDDEGPAKRVKVEEAPAPAVEVKEEDSDEEVDFEDV
ncbi:TFIIE alpha subunit-domain-containing protein [Pyronema omphalodes]|nr:TFIIE alpha subunit-domain-containing protein [Pyronema omphalodes]